MTILRACEDAAITDPAIGLAQRLRAYGKPITSRSVTQLVVTASAFGILYACSVVLTAWNYPVALVAGIAAGVFLVRLFMLQHDCAHYSFFKARWANDAVGRVIGVLTMTPHAYWRTMHGVHHATAGNLDRRGVGDVTTLTVDEYLGLSLRRRLAYRLYRHPVILLGFGPFYLFILKHRAPFDLPLREKRLWLSVLGTNAGIFAVLCGLAVGIGPMGVLKVHLPVMMVASAIGIWLFFIQHQFDGVLWRRQGQWRQEDAALHGSSYYKLPRIFQWLTANIGLHHVHHLCCRIPNYRLREAMAGTSELNKVKSIGLWRSLGFARLALWDETQQALVRFDSVK